MLLIEKNTNQIQSPARDRSIFINETQWSVRDSSLSHNYTVSIM